MSSEKLEELKKDLAELQALEQQAQRSKVKAVLSIEARKIQSEMVKIQEEMSVSKTSSSEINVNSTHRRRYEVKLSNYAWDQSPNLVKFYVTLPKVHTLENQTENIICKFTPKSLELCVKNLGDNDYIFVINNLLHCINPDQSSWKVKTDMVVINTAKVKANVHWSCVTELEKKGKDAHKIDTDASTRMSDPNEGLMSLMKNMYDKGDDEMKRTIAKAFAESQSKKGAPF